MCKSVNVFDHVFYQCYEHPLTSVQLLLLKTPSFVMNHPSEVMFQSEVTCIPLCIVTHICSLGSRSIQV